MIDSIGLAVTFLIFALIAYVLGAWGIAGFSMEIAKVFVKIFGMVSYIFFLVAIFTFITG